MGSVRRKRCRACGIDKAINAFHRDPALRGGRKNICIDCHRAYAKQRRVLGDPDVSLDPEPFRLWVVKQYQFHRDREHLAASLGLHRDTVDRLLSKVPARHYRRIMLSTVDRALSRSETNLADLYPELYPEITEQSGSLDTTLEMETAA